MSHGWVTPNPDGSRARCGGPSICPVCQKERAPPPPHTPQEGRFIGPTEAAAKAGKFLPVDKYLCALQKKLVAERQFPLLWDVVAAAEKVISDHNGDPPEALEDDIPF